MQKESQTGHIHLISQAILELGNIFNELGFEIAEGKHLIPEEQNFDVLNFAKDHPARDTHDTFWVKGTKGTKESTVPRTHISSLQIPYMLENKDNLPIRMVSAGTVYRAETTDSTHEAQFSYIEGLLVDKNVHLGNLKSTIEIFLGKFFGKSVEIRFRPGNFPFVEPGVEVDMQHVSVRGTKWLEIMGAGMVHPQVLKNGGIDSEKYSGFAFGVGIDRLLMIRHNIDDVRVFYNGDLRFVNQF